MMILFPDCECKRALGKDDFNLTLILVFYFDYMGIGDWAVDWLILDKFYVLGFILINVWLR